MALDDMAVFIENLGVYVEGGSTGAWFHFPLNEEEIAERIGLNGNYEEYAIHDTVSVGRFSPFRVGLKTPISVNLKSPMHHVCY